MSSAEKKIPAAPSPQPAGNGRGLALWFLGVFVAVSIAVTIADSKLSANPEKWSIRNDLTNYSLEAARVAGQGLDPYDSRNLKGKNYKYLPLNMVVLTPLTWLPIPAAQGVWVGFNVALLLLALRAHGDLLGGRIPWQAWAATLLIAGNVVWNNIKLGQWNLPVYSLSVIGLWLIFAKRRPWKGCLVLGLGALKFMPVLFGLYFLAKREWRLAGMLAACVLFWAVVPATLWFGPTRHAELLRAWRADSEERVQEMVGQREMVGHSLSTVAQAYLSPDALRHVGKDSYHQAAIASLPREAAKRAAMAIVAATALAVLACLWMSGPAAPPSFDLVAELGAMFMLFLLCSPETRMPHMLTTVTPALALGWLWRSPGATRFERRAAAGALAAGVAAMALSSGVATKISPEIEVWAQAYLSLPTAMIGALLCACLVLRFQRLRSAARVESAPA